jgi:DNA-binding NtrC family response regulator
MARRKQRFRNVEFQVVRREPPFFESCLHAAAEIAAQFQLRGGKIHRDHRRLHVLVAPLPELAAGRVQDPGAERDDHAGPFGGGQECGGSKLRDYKIKLAQRAVAECNGNKTLAARSLHISRTYLHRLIKDFIDEETPEVA